MTEVATARGPLTRDAVLAEARSQIAAEGLAGLSLRKLAARLGVTAPALYGHVQSKGELLRTLADEELGRLVERLVAVAADDPLERVRGQALAYVEHARLHPALFPLLFAFRPDWAGSGTADAPPLASEAFVLSAAAVQEAVDAGLVTETDPLLAALTIWSAAHGVATVLLADPGLPPRVEAALVGSVIDNVLAGLTRPRTTPSPGD